MCERSAARTTGRLAGYKAWGENQAGEVRARAGLAAHARLPARFLLKRLNAIVTTPQLVPGMTAADIGQLTRKDPWRWSAVSGSNNGTTFVVVNDAHSPARQESDLHHEAAHLIRGHRPSPLLQIDGLTLREYDSDAESEAEWLAGCLHLPRAALLNSPPTRGRRHRNRAAVPGQRRDGSLPEIRHRNRSATGVPGSATLRRRTCPGPERPVAPRVRRSQRATVRADTACLMPNWMKNRCQTG